MSVDPEVARALHDEPVTLAHVREGIDTVAGWVAEARATGDEHQARSLTPLLDQMVTNAARIEGMYKRLHRRLHR